MNSVPSLRTGLKIGDHENGSLKTGHGIAGSWPQPAPLKGRRSTNPAVYPTDAGFEEAMKLRFSTYIFKEASVN